MISCQFFFGAASLNNKHFSMAIKSDLFEARFVLSLLSPTFNMKKIIDNLVKKFRILQSTAIEPITKFNSKFFYQFIWRFDLECYFNFYFSFYLIFVYADLSNIFPRTENPIEAWVWVYFMWKCLKWQHSNDNRWV